MRLNKIRLAGFKSFVDPTTVQFPANLTGVVGPNGCGKSNVIDAVRWVMGELSARHLRGESMADVVFNGSSARKPIGSASVELVFDNSDGKIAGAYANYAEVSLKRTVSRDGESAYFINGGRCRRKDITQLFLGTGLGSRSYAIIEQGMISRVIEARHDDMRAFLEEAAGVSLYKERRRETESRIADARENLARVKDLRDEVDQQINRLQRQASVARRYQEYKERERLLQAETLALRVREIDQGVDRHDSTMRASEMRMQGALADQRAAEAAIEKQRELHAEQSALVTTAQAGFFGLGNDISRLEEGIRYAREARERAQRELAQTTASMTLLLQRIESDEKQLETLRLELADLEPHSEERHRREQVATAQLAEAETAQAAWQVQWEAFNREFGSCAQTVHVEAARIEQLDSQRHRLQAQSDRLLIEHEALLGAEAEQSLQALTGKEEQARGAADELSQAIRLALDSVQQMRAELRAADEQLELARREREKARSELVSLEALQKAALREKNAHADRWLSGLGLSADKGRLAERLEVDSGWERAVETVLGDYLEAVGIESLDQVAPALTALADGSVGFFETGARGDDDAAVPDAGSGSLASRVRGPRPLLELLAKVRTCDSLPEALAQRAALRDGRSLVTAAGEWVGRDWMRVNRGGDVHAGVLEREHRLKILRDRTNSSEQRVQSSEQQVTALRARVVQAEQAREAVQSKIQSAHRDHAELRGQLATLRAQIEENTRRRDRNANERAEVERHIADTLDGLRQARARHESASELLARLDQQRASMESERESHRQRTHEARAAAQTAQVELRDALVRLESHRSATVAGAAALARLAEQRGTLDQQRQQLEQTLAEGDSPITDMQQRLNDLLQQRLEAEAELDAARRALEGSDAELRDLEQRRLEAMSRVESARQAMEQARLTAQESRVRRESLMEQFNRTECDFAQVLAGVAEEAEVEEWERRCAAIRADIEKLGQVNLAAIDELAQQSERKTYLESQYADVSDALATLESAMRKIDGETRARFDDTFNRVNAGLKEKFPRLFGGGSAYLELVGDDPLTAGVAIMARPPGKRNSTISQLSGGEKALTAVALVFSIFDLNPAPFCLLDEVDAPLDEHNVGRFCDIVREMSDRVQFIFITHNKVTMELASQLVGVTMNEPGVSRLVAVDIDEAVRLAAV